MNKKQILIDIIQNIGDMLKNNEELGTNGIAESFVDWCELGAIFNAYGYNEEEKVFAIEIMNKTNKNIDNLTQQFYALFEEIEAK